MRTRTLSLHGLLIAALLVVCLPCSWASTIVYRFRILDDSNAAVAGATIVQNTTKSFASSTLGNAVTVTLTPVDLGNGDYGVAYDPEGSNGEIIVNYTVSKAGSTITGSNASISVVLTKDSSRILNADVASSTIKAKTDLVATNAADSPNAVTAQGNITGLPAAVWGVGSRTLTAFAFNPSTVSLSANDEQALSSLRGSYVTPGGFVFSASALANAPTGSGSGGSFPANFSLLNIDGSGKVALQAAEHTAIQNEAGAGVLAAVVDGGFTLKQMQSLSMAVLAGNFTLTRNTGAKTITVTYYRPTDPGSTTTALATLVTNYSDTALTLPTSRSVTFTNKP